MVVVWWDGGEAMDEVVEGEEVWWWDKIRLGGALFAKW